MNSRTPKKLIFFYFLFINFLNPSKSADFQKLNQKENNQSNQLIWSKLSNNNSSNPKKFFFNIYSEEFPSKKKVFRETFETTFGWIKPKAKRVGYQIR